MVTWLETRISSMGLTAMELFFLHYLVYGLGNMKFGSGEKGKQLSLREVWGEGRRGRRILTLAVLFAVGLLLRNHRISSGDSGLGSYINILTMASFYYAVLVCYLKLNPRLAVYYLVVFDIPADVCDLVVFVTLLRVGGVDVSGPALPLFAAFVYLTACFLLRFLVFTVLRQVLDNDRQRVLSNMQLFLIAIAILPFLYMRDLGFWLPVGSDEIGYSSLLFLAVTGAISLILVIGNERIVYFHIQRNELLKMQHMIRHQHEQYEMRREAVNLVNQKYHDMRHQLVAILGMDDVNEIHGYVSSLRQEIKPFESFFRTGNQLMDIILTDKAEVCRKKQIQLVPTVDGQALSGLEAADLCTIFGNALDNAIESCEKMPEGKTRWITLKVCTIKGFLAIHVENPYVQRPLTEAGRFLTTKMDSENHGYGLQGIRQTAEKYQGTMETELTDSQFLLTILIPQAEKKEAAPDLTAS